MNDAIGWFLVAINVGVALVTGSALSMLIAAGLAVTVCMTSDI